MGLHVRSGRLAGGSALALAALMALPAAGLAADEPNGAASCMGIEHAAISPPGTSDEEPGGSRQFVEEVREMAADQGVAAGSIFSFIASLHEGSHESCDEALGGDADAATTGATGAALAPHASATLRAWPKAV